MEGRAAIRRWRVTLAPTANRTPKDRAWCGGASLYTALCSFVQGKLCHRDDHISEGEEGAVASNNGMTLRALLCTGQI